MSKITSILDLYKFYNIDFVIKTSILKYFSFYKHKIFLENKMH